MKKLLTLACLLISAPAWAQSPQCPTRPTGDNSNACASTAFVNKTVTTGIPLTSGHIFVGNASNVAVDVAMSGDITITNAGVTAVQHIGITQALSGVSTGFNAANFINVTSDTVNNGDGNEYTALSIIHKTGGSTVLGQRSGLHVEQWLTAATNPAETQKDIIAGTFQVYANNGNNGGNFIGLNSIVDLGSSITGAGGLTGLEIDIIAQTASSVTNKFGITIVQEALDAVQGTTTDASIAWYNNGSSGGWKTGFLFSSGTVASGGVVIDMSALAASSGGGPAYLLKGPSLNFFVDGNGNINANTLTIGRNNSGPLIINGFTSGTGTFAVQGIMGSAVWTLPTNTGTMVVSASSPLAINATTGNIACTTCVTTGGALGTPSSGTGTNLTGIPIDAGTINTLPINRGGTNATTTQAAAANLKVPYILAQSAVQVSHTGDTAEFTLGTITVPANAMGANGCIRVTFLMSWTNSANNKTQKLYFNGTGGTAYSSVAFTTTAGNHAQIQICNRNATNSQVGNNYFAQGGWGANTTAIITSAVDTTVSVNIVITGQLANSGEAIALESYTAELLVP